MKQTYIRVDCKRSRDGTEKPSVIYWDDGRKWRVSKVLHISTPAENEFEGIRYTILVGSAEQYLYKAGDKWYVELKG